MSARFPQCRVLANAVNALDAALDLGTVKLLHAVKKDSERVQVQANVPGLRAAKIL